MRNADAKATEQKELYLSMAKPVVEAATAEDDVLFQQAMATFAAEIEARILKEAESLAGVNDTAVLAARGIPQQTAEEKNYFQKLAEAMRAPDVKQAIADFDVVMPKTVVNDVFVDLEANHPLLQAIDFQNVGAVTEWLVNENPDQLATWSALCAEIVKELTSGFKKIDFSQNKLSAFLPVCKAMLDLGPAWLQRYVTAVLQEALYLGLEDGIINGKGQTANLHEPIGMRKNLAAAVDPVTGYADKVAIAFTSFDPASYGNILADMAKSDDGKARVVTGVIFICNPVDYFKRVMPATTVRTTNGGYNSDVFPFPTTVVQSIRIEEGKALIGIAGRYFMGIGTGKSGKIEYSDEYRFLEDERVYLVKLYGHGQPKDNNAFKLLDITNLKPTVLQVEVTNAADFPVAGADEIPEG